METHSYLIIDLKSFYASCECVMRGLDPMTTDLVVADRERGRGTICLAVSPSLKAKGVRNRCRVFEIPRFLSYIMATPRMQLYLNYAAEIYSIYLDYFSKEDIFVYSVDEAFIDISGYTCLYHRTPREMAVFLLGEIERRLGLPASCGIGTNLYLAKVALDILAKHEPDRIAALDAQSFRERLWDHRPLTDFWRIGSGISRRLARMGIRTMRELAHAPYPKIRKAFGIDGFILYDHAWGREPTTIAEIRACRPAQHSVSSSQVLPRDYPAAEAETILVEMADQLALELARRRVRTRSVSLWVGSSRAPGHMRPPVGGTVRFSGLTNAGSELRAALVSLYRRRVPADFSVRRLSLCANRVESEEVRELSLFAPEREREHDRQLAILEVQARFGRNALLLGTDYLEGATRRERNQQIGGHKAYGDGEAVQPRKDLPALRCAAGAAAAAGAKGKRA